MASRTRARTAVVERLDRVTRAVARRGAAAAQDAAGVDLLVADQLRRRDGDLADPAAWTRFMRGAFGPQRHHVEQVRGPAGHPDERTLRIATLVESLRSDVPPLGTASARRLADAADVVRGDRDPFVRPNYAADVGHHAAMASSSATQARFVTAVVRFAAARRIIEVGTAYGLGTLALADAAGPSGRVVTAERSEPQLSIARRVLAAEETVTVVGGIAADNAAEVTALLGGKADMLFHDGAHSHEAYVEDFAAYEPLLVPGAVVVFDDIDWHDDRWHPDADTYAGWQEVSRHPRVRAAFEVDGTWGLLLLH